MEDVIKCVQTHKDPISVAVVKDMNCRKIIPPVKVNDNVLYIKIVHAFLSYCQLVILSIDW